GRDRSVEECAVNAGRAFVQGAHGRLHLGTAGEAESLLVLDDGQRRLQVAQRTWSVGRSAGASREWMAVGVVAGGQGPAQPAVDLAACGVARLPDPDRLEMGEGRVRVADALDDRDSALVPQALDAAQVVVQPVLR